MTDFDYRLGVTGAGWRQIGRRWIAEPRRTKTSEIIRDVYEGTALELCFFIGVGPEWEAWVAVPYRIGWVGLPVSEAGLAHLCAVHAHTTAQSAKNFVTGAASSSSRAAILSAWASRASLPGAARGDIDRRPYGLSSNSHVAPGSACFAQALIA
jgi:hypothetical protein